MNRHKILWGFFFVLFFVHSNAQDNAIDSLNKVLKGAKEDTSKVSTLNALSKKYFATKPEESVRIGMSARDLAKKLNFSQGLALALKNIGIGYYQQGIYVDAIN